MNETESDALKLINKEVVGVRLYDAFLALGIPEGDIENLPQNLKKHLSALARPAEPVGARPEKESPAKVSTPITEALWSVRASVPDTLYPSMGFRYAEEIALLSIDQLVGSLDLDPGVAFEIDSALQAGGQQMSFESLTPSILLEQYPVRGEIPVILATVAFGSRPLMLGSSGIHTLAELQFAMERNERAIEGAFASDQQRTSFISAVKYLLSGV